MWDIKNLTLTLDGDTTVNRSTNVILQQVAEKFPVARWELTEDNAKTYVVNYAWSVDNENWTTLLNATGQTNGGTSTDDLSTQSSQPSGAPYLRITITSSANLGAGETASLALTTASWVHPIHGGVTKA